MEYVCDICGEKISGDSVKFINHGEKHIMEIIKRKYPEWVEKNGICQKCIDYYRNQLKG